MSAIRRLYRGENDINFVKWWRRGLILSAVLIVISVASLFTRGLNLGIDFEGGVSWEVKAPGVSVSDARSALDGVGEGQAKIQIVGTETLRVQGSAASDGKQDEVRQVLADLAETDTSEVTVSTVGPSWGKEVTKSAERALVAFLAFILLYLSIRLEWKMAIGAVLAMVHDVVISVGVYRSSNWRSRLRPRSCLDDPRLLDLRHHRRVRQGEGEPGPSALPRSPTPS
jgi:preprotein translocase subunit SecF